MNIEQIKEELTMLEGHLLQNAIDNTDGSIGEIKQYLFFIMDTAFENSSSLDTSDALIALSEQVLDTLNWSVKDLKPFEQLTI